MSVIQTIFGIFYAHAQYLPNFLKHKMIKQFQPKLTKEHQTSANTYLKVTESNREFSFLPPVERNKEIQEKVAAFPRHYDEVADLTSFP